MNQDELEDWALRVLQTLQDFCDEAQEAAGDPYGEGELLDVRVLMLEYEHMIKGLSLHLVQLPAMTDEEKEKG